jgi:hypothetical protein
LEKPVEQAVISSESFGVATNLLICLLVTVYGAFAWLPFRRTGQAGLSPEPFRHCAYVCWWASWACWSLLWAWTGYRQSIDPHTLDAEQKILYKIPDLALDNLNAIFLVLVFFAIIRGDKFRVEKILPLFLLISTSMAAGYAVLYILSHWLTLEFTYGIHNAWSLCMSAAAPILVGWAVYLRFNSVWVLAIGLVYAFIQPVAYAFDLPNPASGTEDIAAQTLRQLVSDYQPVVDMTLGLLKILWAILFMKTLAHAESEGDCLVAETDNPGLLGEWDGRTLGQAILLGASYVLLLVAMLLTFHDDRWKRIEAFGVSIGIITSFLCLIDIGLRVWTEVLKDRDRSSTRVTQSRRGNRSRAIAAQPRPERPARRRRAKRQGRERSVITPITAGSETSLREHSQARTAEEGD